jgi:hypothetical protein
MIAEDMIAATTEIAGMIDTSVATTMTGGMIAAAPAVTIAAPMTGLTIAIGTMIGIVVMTGGVKRGRMRAGRKSPGRKVRSQGNWRNPRHR